MTEGTGTYVFSLDELPKNQRKGGHLLFTRAETIALQQFGVSHYSVKSTCRLGVHSWSAAGLPIGSCHARTSD